MSEGRNELMTEVRYGCMCVIGSFILPHTDLTGSHRQQLVFWLYLTRPSPALSRQSSAKPYRPLLPWRGSPLPAPQFHQREEEIRKGQRK